MLSCLQPSLFPSSKAWRIPAAKHNTINPFEHLGQPRTLHFYFIPSPLFAAQSANYLCTELEIPQRLVNSISCLVNAGWPRLCSAGIRIYFKALVALPGQVSGPFYLFGTIALCCSHRPRLDPRPPCHSGDAFTSARVSPSSASKRMLSHKGTPRYITWLN